MAQVKTSILFLQIGMRKFELSNAHNQHQTDDHRGKNNKSTKNYYEPCLKALDIKYRNIYQTRHTFACLSIDAGAELNWVKMMLGHNTLKMILKRYGNRVNRDKKERVSLFSKPTIKEEMYK